MLFPSLFPQMFTFHDSRALEFGVATSATTVPQNRTLGVVVWDDNSLGYKDQLTLPTVFSGVLAELRLGPCWSWASMPFGVVVFQGRYTLGNISSASPLQIFEPGTLYCPIADATTSFTFLPRQNVTAEVDLNGLWTSTGVLRPFALGVYTLVAGDAWGNLKIVYFQVKTP